MASADIAIVGLICLDIVQRVNLVAEKENEKGEKSKNKSKTKSVVPGESSQSHWLPIGSMINVFSPAIFAGGGCVCNTGIAAFKLLGGKGVALVANLGQDHFADVLKEVLKADIAAAAAAASAQISDDAQKLLFKHLRYSASVPTAYSIVLQPDGIDRSIIHNGSANHLFRPLLDCAAFLAEQRQLPAAQRIKVLHFGYPTFMRTTAEDGGAALVQLFREVKGTLGATTSVDTASIDDHALEWLKTAKLSCWKEYLARILPHTDIFMPSVDELAGMLGVAESQLYSPPGSDATSPAASHTSVPEKQLNLSTVREMGRVCVEELGCAMALIKCGAWGIYLKTTASSGRLQKAGSLVTSVVDAAPSSSSSSAWLDVELFVPSFQVTVAGTVGAGDCAIAGFLVALQQRATSPLVAVKAAAAAGAFCVEHITPTGGIPFGVDRLMERAVLHPPPLLPMPLCFDRGPKQQQQQQRGEAISGTNLRTPAARVFKEGTTTNENRRNGSKL